MTKKTIIKISIILVVTIIAFSILINFLMIKNVENKIFNNENAPKMQVGIVLGAGVLKNKSMSGTYKDRVDTALKLYMNGKIEKIIVSGDNGKIYYDEITPAKIYLIENGVKKDDLFLDYAGFRTYDSIYRAKEIFRATELNIITQNFHLPRAIYICEKKGLKCIGASADLHTYVNTTKNNVREFFARINAFTDIIFNVKPKFLGEQIPISGPSNTIVREIQ